MENNRHSSLFLSLILSLSLLVFLFIPIGGNIVQEKRLIIEESGCPSNCSGNGVCSYSNSTLKSNETDRNESNCICFQQFGGNDCSYHKKSKVKALLLSLFIGYFGADQFYLGSVEKGVAKLMLFLSICILPCCLGWMLLCTPSNRYGTVTVPTVIAVLFIILAGFGWWMADWIMILTGEMKDGEGYSLH